MCANEHCLKTADEIAGGQQNVSTMGSGLEHRIRKCLICVIIVGALIAVGPLDMNFSKVMGFLAVPLASINIFGGFIVSQRMLQMYRKKG